MRLLLLSMFVFLSVAPVAAQHFTLVTEEQPPMNFTDPETGRVVGISTDLVSAIMREAGYDYSLVLMPWKRAYRQALLDENTCIFTTVRTPEREKLFKWVSPLFTSGWAFYGMPDRGLGIEKVEDLSGLVAAATTETISISNIRSIPGLKVLEVPRDQRALVLMSEGRADVWVSGVFTAFKGAEDAGIAVPELAFLWHPIELSLACNRATDDEAIARLNTANKLLDPYREELKARHYYYTRER
ncbi:MAG: transporter substrate-binding domain-containing protein [Alphaproteobacteria bacterium]|nr:transporter substrate-binding domain-containing protein [Alphaproteobacteria bacterium]